MLRVRCTVCRRRHRRCHRILNRLFSYSSFVHKGLLLAGCCWDAVPTRWWCHLYINVYIMHKFPVRFLADSFTCAGRHRFSQAHTPSKKKQQNPKPWISGRKQKIGNFSSDAYNSIEVFEVFKYIHYVLCIMCMLFQFRFFFVFFSFCCELVEFWKTCWYSFPVACLMSLSRAKKRWKK